MTSRMQSEYETLHPKTIRASTPPPFPSPLWTGGGQAVTVLHVDLSSPGTRPEEGTRPPPHSSRAAALRRNRAVHVDARAEFGPKPRRGPRPLHVPVPAFPPGGVIPAEPRGIYVLAGDVDAVLADPSFGEPHRVGETEGGGCRRGHDGRGRRRQTEGDGARRRRAARVKQGCLQRISPQARSKRVSVSPRPDGGAAVCH